MYWRSKSAPETFESLSILDLCFLSSSEVDSLPEAIFFSSSLACFAHRFNCLTFSSALSLAQVAELHLHHAPWAASLTKSESAPDNLLLLVFVSAASPVRSVRVSLGLKRNSALFLI